MIIRPFVLRDYRAIHEVYRLAWPGYAGSVEVLKHQDRQAGETGLRRWVADTGSGVVGFAELRSLPEAAASGRFAIGVFVRPDARERGVGRALYARLLEGLMERGAEAARASAVCEPDDGLRFLERRGFRVDRRYVELELDVTRFDPAGLEGVEARSAAADIEIVSLREIVEDCGRELHALTEELRQDAPFPDGAGLRSYGQFRQQVLDHPGLAAEASFVVRQHGRCVGLTMTWWGGSVDEMFTGLTGVRQAFRRQGLATALKSRAVGAARELGCTRLRTVNQEGDRAIVELNRRLGFVPRRTWCSLILELKKQSSPGQPASIDEEG